MVDKQRPDGIVLAGNRQVGTFIIDPWPNEGVRIKMQEGMLIREYLEYTAENGMTIELQLAPRYDDTGE